MRQGIVLALVLALPLALGLLTLTPAPAHAAAAAAAPAGTERFTHFNCNMCHSIESQGIAAKTKSTAMKAPDLSNEGNLHDAAWISGWLQHKEKKDGKLHKGPFKGTDAELQALVGWLMTLKKA